MGYLGFVLLPKQASFALERVAQLLNRPSVMRGPDGVVAQQVIESERLTLRWPDWSLRVVYADAPFVLLEAQELAAQFAADRADADAIARSEARLELFGDDDPDMAYFNNFLIALETLGELPNAFVFEAASGSFL
jgi:hypothetical protein